METQTTSTNAPSGGGKQGLFTLGFVLVLLQGLFYMTGIMMPNPIMAGYLAELGIDGTWSGITIGCYALVSMFMVPVTGALTRRIDPRLLAGIGLVCMATCMFFTALTSSLVVIILLRTLGGTGYALCAVSLSTCVAMMAPPDKVGMAISTYSLVQALGTALGPTMGAELADRMGYRVPFWTSAALSFTGAVIAVFAFKVVHLDRPAPEPRDKRTKQPFFVLRAWPFAAMVLLDALPYSAINAFLRTIIAKRELDFSVSSFFLAVALFMLVIRLAVNHWIDRWPYRTFYLMAIPSLVIGIIILQMARSPLHLVIAAFFVAGSHGLVMPVSQTACISLSGKGNRGAANSTYYIGMDLGNMFGSMLAGRVYDALGFNAVLPVLLLCPVLSAVLVLTKTVDRGGDQ